MTLEEIQTLIEQHHEDIEDFWTSSGFRNDRQRPEWYYETLFKFNYKSRYLISIGSYRLSSGFIHKLNESHRVSSSELFDELADVKPLWRTLIENGAACDEDIGFINESTEEAIVNYPNAKVLIHENEEKYFTVNIFNRENLRNHFLYKDSIEDCFNFVDLDRTIEEVF